MGSVVGMRKAYVDYLLSTEGHISAVDLSAQRWKGAIVMTSLHACYRAEQQMTRRFTERAKVLSETKG